MTITHRLLPVLALLLALPWSAGAQDIRGMEICTAERQMDRRTGCLQANVEFLQQALAKQARESNDKIAALARDTAAAKADIAALKDTVAKLQNELAQLKSKADPAAKP